MQPSSNQSQAPSPSLPHGCELSRNLSSFPFVPFRPEVTSSTSSLTIQFYRRIHQRDRLALPPHQVTNNASKTVTPTATELRSCTCESRGGRPGLLVPNSPYGLCGREATLNLYSNRAQELCGSRSGSPGLPAPPIVLMVSLDVKQPVMQQSSGAV